ncbi:MAG: transposase [Ignavibacteriales bacterium]|nr:transposase [Ignavibacteriales bacterium]
MNKEKIYYRRNLPHYNPPCATFFITFRLNGSLPRDVVKRLEEQYRQDIKVLKDSKGEKELQKEKISVLQKRYFGKFDDLLDGNTLGPHWLQEEKIATIVMEALTRRDGKVYNLNAAVIMPNHLHVVFAIEQPDLSEPLYKALQSLKRYTALKANKILQRSGAFWQHESYDHVVRDGNELEKIIHYVLKNPVKAGLVKHPSKWKWLYVRPDLAYLYDSI